MESQEVRAETTESVHEGLKVSTREHQTKTDTRTPQSPGTARITAFYPSSPAAEFGTYLTHSGAVPAQQFHNAILAQHNEYPYTALFPSYSYDASMALAALAIGEARSRLQYTSPSPNHHSTTPSTPQVRHPIRKLRIVGIKARGGSGQPMRSFSRSWSKRGNIAKSRSDVTSWRKGDEASPIQRSATVPHPTGSLTFLEKFKAFGGQGFTLESVKDNIASLALDQSGSRWLQTQLQEQGLQAGNCIFPEIVQNALLLSRDIFGNYVVQKTFIHTDQANRDALGRALKGRMRRLSFDVYGCRVVQQAIENVSADLAVELMMELEEVVLHCVVDANGNHVFQRCIECLPSEQIASLITPLLSHVKDIAHDQYGCRVIQRIIESCSVEELRDLVLDEVIATISNLASTEYGNYVVQHVAEHGGEQYREKALRRIGTNFRFLSHQKFSSRVVEKFLEFATDDELQYIIDSMFPTIDESFSEEDWVVDMMLDPFANYVLQKIFEVGCPETKKMFASIIVTHRKQLLRSSFGKNVVDAAVKEGIIKATEITLPMLSDTSSGISS